LTATFQDRTFDEALAALTQGAMAPVVVGYNGGVVEVHAR
jgi:hypothetical protein